MKNQTGPSTVINIETVSDNLSERNDDLRLSEDDENRSFLPGKPEAEDDTTIALRLPEINNSDDSSSKKSSRQSS